MNAAENLAAALAYRQQSKPDAAVASALAALKEDPSLGAAWECAASIYMRQGRWAHGRALLESAVKFVPGNLTLEIWYALALAETDALAAADARIEDVLRRAPDNAQAQFAKAEILCSAGHYDRALPFYAAAAKDAAVRKPAVIGEANARYMTGDFSGALPGLSLLEDEAAGAPPLPLWNGDPAQHVVLYGSQGFGDMLMFLRYAKNAQGRCAKMALRIPYQLARLVRDSFPDLPLIVTKDAGDTHEPVLPPGAGFDLPKDATARCPLFRLCWTLDGAFHPRAENVPYLRADKAKIAAWEERLAALPRPRIGLVWSGSPRNANDHRRSIAYELLQPLIDRARPHLVSLQTGPESARATGAGIFDAAAMIGDFSDSTALIAALDLVITVDTAVAHLAGALGKPVWNMMPFKPTDWRWLLGRTDTIWYPSMRLFRQKAPGDWAGVISNVIEGFQAL